MSKLKKQKLNSQNQNSLAHYQADERPVSVGLPSSANQPSSTVDFQTIQKKAYEIYERKGGQPLDNWLEAEEFLRQNRSRGTAESASQAGELESVKSMAN